MNQKFNKKGFTLVELMLAMGFVSALLLAIAMTVIQIGNIYTRGVTLKTINQAGGDISSELQRGMVSVGPFNVNPGGPSYITQAWGGRLCTGQYSYIWNYGKDFSNSNRNKYSSGNSDIKFVKIYDSSLYYCTPSPVAYPNVDPDGAIELLSTSSDSTIIAVHDFKIQSFATDSNTGQQLYSIEFLLGTNDANVFDSSTNECIISQLSYCAVNRFNIVVRAGGANK